MLSFIFRRLTVAIPTMLILVIIVAIAGLKLFA